LPFPLALELSVEEEGGGEEETAAGEAALADDDDEDLLELLCFLGTSGGRIYLNGYTSC
jgi:hypothetical protein